MVPSPAELKYFRAVVQTANLSRAANKLSLSQPTLSLAIKRLEERIGTALFIRHKQGVTLTTAGKKFNAQIKKLIENWDDLHRDIIDAHHEITGTVSLGSHATTALFFKEFFPDFLEKNPGLTFSLKHLVSVDMVEQVINSELDIAIVVNPIMHPDLIVRKIAACDSTFWKSSGTRPMQDIRSDQLVIICDPNIPRTPYLLKRWKNLKLQNARLLTTSSLEIVADLTASGCGVGILPSAFVNTLSYKLERIYGAPSCRDELYLVYRKENREVKAVQAVVDAIKTYAKQTG